MRTFNHNEKNTVKSIISNTVFFSFNIAIFTNIRYINSAMLKIITEEDVKLKSIKNKIKYPAFFLSISIRNNKQQNIRGITKEYTDIELNVFVKYTGINPETRADNKDDTLSFVRCFTIKKTIKTREHAKILGSIFAAIIRGTILLKKAST